MMDRAKIDAFLADLQAISEKHGIVVDLNTYDRLYLSEMGADWNDAGGRYRLCADQYSGYGTEFDWFNPDET